MNVRSWRKADVSRMTAFDAKRRAGSLWRPARVFAKVRSRPRAIELLVFPLVLIELRSNN